MKEITKTELFAIQQKIVEVATNQNGKNKKLQRAIIIRIFKRKSTRRYVNRTFELLDKYFDESISFY